MYKIAVSGKAKSGKNTLSKIILDEIAIAKGKKAIISQTIAFADPIKEIIKIMFPHVSSEIFLYGSSELRGESIPNAYSLDGNLLTYRQALIDIGTNGRNYNPNIWVNCFDHKYQNLLLNNKILSECDQGIEAVIVSDVRFKEELEYLKNKQFYLIKINRKDITVINHASETEQDKFNFSVFDSVINNDGSLEDLSLFVRKAIVPSIIQ